MHTMQEDFDADYQSEDVQGYFVGTTAIVWEVRCVFLLSRTSTQ